MYDVLRNISYNTRSDWKTFVAMVLLGSIHRYRIHGICNLSYSFSIVRCSFICIVVLLH
eukprot:UN01864